MTEEKTSRKQNRKNFMMQAGYHAFALVGAVVLWGAADTWATVSELAIATGFSVAASVLFGIAICHIIHEWSHFLGAWATGSTVVYKDKPSPLFFDFDYTQNSPRQFFFLSIGGSLGNAFVLVMIWLFIPIDTPARAMLLATAIAMAIYVAVLEFPILKRIRDGQPGMTALMEHFGQGPSLFYRATAAGAAGGLLSWIWML